MLSTGDYCIQCCCGWLLKKSIRSVGDSLFMRLCMLQDIPKTWAQEWVFTWPHESEYVEIHLYERDVPRVSRCSDEVRTEMLSVTLLVENWVTSESVNMKLPRHVSEVVVKRIDGTVLCTASQNGKQVQ